MTQIDIEPTSPPSTQHQQLDRINTAIDQTLSQLETTSQHVMHTIAHVLGMKWYQKSTQHIMSYQRWREIQQQLSKLTYTCGGIDEALMRHLFSLDAIMGDDTIRTLRRTSVHRIKHAISRVEIITTYMYKLQYWWKKWIQHQEQVQEETISQQEETVPMEPATPLARATTSTSSPALKSTNFSSASPQPSSRVISSPQPSSRTIPSKAVKAKKALNKSIKSPTLRPTSAKTTIRSPAVTSRSASPALSSRGITSASASPASTSRNLTSASASPSPILPKRHITIPTQPIRPSPSSPRFHVQTTSTGLIITATLPDVSRDSLDITVRGHLLRIAGICQGEPFLREMELPDNVDVDRLDASWQQDTDVLRIEVPLKRKVSSRHMYEDENEMDVDQYHPYYYQQPSPYRCAPSYVHPSYPRRPVYTAPRSMFGSPFGFW